MYKFVGNLLSLFLRTAKNDGIYFRIIIHDPFKCEIFVFRIYKIVGVVYVLCSLVAAAYHNFLIVMKVTFCNFLYLFAHGS